MARVGAVEDERDTEMFRFYQIFFDFQWNLGIIPYKFNQSSKSLVYVIDNLFRARNFLCNCLFTYILLQNLLLTSINILTQLEFEPIEHSLLLQISWILIFILITSVLLIFELKAGRIMEAVTAWIHLEYFIQGFGFTEPQKCRRRAQQFILGFKLFVLNISLGSLGLVLLFWFDPRFPVFIYAFFQLEQLYYASCSCVSAYLLKTFHLVFECSFLFFINGIYALGFLLPCLIYISIAGCLEKLGEVARRGGDGGRKTEVIVVYKRIEDLIAQLNHCFRHLIVLEEVTSLIALSVYCYLTIKQHSSVFQLIFFLIVLFFFTAITSLLYFPIARLHLSSKQTLLQLKRLAKHKEDELLLRTCTPLNINPFRLHSIEYTTIPIFIGLVTNYVVLLICM